MSANHNDETIWVKLLTPVFRQLSDDLINKGGFDDYKGSDEIKNDYLAVSIRPYHSGMFVAGSIQYDGSRLQTRRDDGYGQSSLLYSPSIVRPTLGLFVSGFLS